MTGYYEFSDNAVHIPFPGIPSRLSYYLSLCTLGGAALLASSTVHAAPGVPQIPAVIFTEDFQDLPPATSGEILTGYQSVGGQTYSADSVWLTSCNGLLSSADQPVAGNDGQTASCGNQEAWNVTQQLAQALGTFRGQATPATNFAVSAYTSNNPGAGRVEFETVNTVALPTPSRFIAVGIDVAAANCYRASAPQLQFYLLDAGSPVTAGGQIDGCQGSLLDMPALGNAAASTGGEGAILGTHQSGGVLINTAAVGIRMTNANGSGGGNDHAFDNIQLLDVSPTLDKSFSPVTQAVGGASVLTFTVTNTAELGAKAGWSFTDHLPDGLVVAATPAASTTCPSGVVTAAAGATEIDVTGNLAGSMESCTISVSVTSNTAATYANGPDNIESAGLNPPQVSTVTFTAPSSPQAAKPVPVNAPWGLLLLSGMLSVMAGAFRVGHKRRQAR
jgi:hypothetical protein